MRLHALAALVALPLAAAQPPASSESPLELLQRLAQPAPDPAFSFLRNPRRPAAPLQRPLLPPPDVILDAIFYQTAEPTPEEWQALPETIRSLGSDEFSAREAAQRALERHESAIAPLLEAARDDENPEARKRVRELLARIEFVENLSAGRGIREAAAGIWSLCISIQDPAQRSVFVEKFLARLGENSVHGQHVALGTAILRAYEDTTDAALLGKLLKVLDGADREMALGFARTARHNNFVVRALRHPDDGIVSAVLAKPIKFQHEDPHREAVLAALEPLLDRELSPAARAYATAPLFFEMANPRALEILLEVAHGAEAQPVVTHFVAELQSGRHSGDALVELVAPLRNDQDSRIRAAAIGILLNRPEPEHVRMAVASLGLLDSDQLTDLAAMTGAGRIGQDLVLEELRAASAQPGGTNAALLLHQLTARSPAADFEIPAAFRFR